MKGLLIKDLLVLKRSNRNMIVLLVICTLFLAVFQEGTFSIAYFTFVGTFVAMGTIGYDDYDNGKAYLFSLPFERKTYVMEKYALCMGSAVLCWAAASAVKLICLAVSGEMEDIGQWLIFISVILILSWLLLAVMLPIYIRFGSEKGRIIVALAIAMCMVVSIFITDSFRENKVVFEAVDMSGIGMGTLAALGIAAVVISMFVSYLVSRRYVERMEM